MPRMSNAAVLKRKTEMLRKKYLEYLGMDIQILLIPTKVAELPKKFKPEEAVPVAPEAEPPPEKTEEQILAEEYAKDAQWREDNGVSPQSYEKWLVHWKTMNG